MKKWPLSSVVSESVSHTVIHSFMRFSSLTVPDKQTTQQNGRISMDFAEVTRSSFVSCNAPPHALPQVSYFNTVPGSAEKLHEIAPFSKAHYLLNSQRSANTKRKTQNIKNMTLVQLR